MIQLTTPWSSLSDRELEVVGLLYELDSNKAIARRLSLAEATVKQRFTHAMSKVGVTSRLQLAVKWELAMRGLA